MESSDSDQTSARHCWLMFGLAAASFMLLLFRVQATGEEAVYSVEAYEQWYAHDWLRPTFLGGFYQRPPLFTDLIAAIAGLIGWQHCLAAARMVSALATVGSGLLLAGFCRRLGATPGRSAFTALVYLTLGEPLLYYGWLGYSDALFGALTLGGMLAIWLAAREQRARWLLLACVCADAAFLTKALTAYVFVGAAGLLCLWHYRAWRCLRLPRFWLALLPLALPALWYALAPTGQVMAHGMLGDITAKLGGQGASAYLSHLARYAGNALLNLLPAAGVLLWHAASTLLARRRRGIAAAGPVVQPTAAHATQAAPQGTLTRPSTQSGLDKAAWLAAGIALLNFLPYWLAPQSGVRYLMPLYGLVAVWFAGLLWPTTRLRRQLLNWATAAIALKWLAAGWLFPLYTEHLRPDLLRMAWRVNAVTSDEQLYADTDAWVGISVVALLDTTLLRDGRLRPPLQRPPADWNDAMVLSDHPSTGAPPSQRVLDLGGVSLYCRGSACR